MFGPAYRWPNPYSRFFLLCRDLVFVLVVIVAVPVPTHAQTSFDSTVRLTATAVRTEVPPVIDGNLNDVVWKTATRLSGFVQQRPLEGAPASEKTEVYVIIGPEGDFSDAERNAMNHAKVDYAILGPRRLRSESAAMAAIANLNQLMGG